MSIKYYSINNIVHFSIKGPEIVFKSIGYQDYLTDAMPEESLDFAFEFGDFIPDNAGCVIFDDNYYVRENYLYCPEDVYKFLKWEIEIENIEGKPIRVKCAIKGLLKFFKASYRQMEGFLIDSLVHYVLFKKSWALVHASCTIRGNRGILFASRGGGGKTTLVTRLYRYQYNFISDNFTIIGLNSHAIGLIQFLNIFSYNINESIKANMAFHEKLNLGLNVFLYRITNQYIKLFTKLNPVRFYHIGSEEKPCIDTIFLLTPVKNLPGVIIRKISKSTLVDHLVYNQILEFPIFEKYRSYYTYQFPHSALAQHWVTYKDILHRNLEEKISFLKVDAPERYQEEDIQKILSEIQNASGTPL